MRILFLTDNFPPETNAPATRTWEHAKVWVADGHDVTIITTAPNFPRGVVYDGYRNAWRQVEVMEGIRVVRVKSYIAANSGTLRRMLDYLSFGLTAPIASLFERRPDIIIATSPQFFCALGGWLTSILRWRPWVFELRDLWPDSIVAVGAMRAGFAIRRLERLELFLYRRARLVISVTQAFKANLVERGIDEGKIEVVTNGVRADAFQRSGDGAQIRIQAGLEDRVVFGYVGTHGMAHALDTVLDAAEALVDRNDIGFLFAGDGAEADRLRVRTEPLPNVAFLGPQPRARMPEIWSSCDVALVNLRNTPTFRTVIPSKIFEAMAMGVPILMALPEGEATGIVNHHKVGLTCPPEDPGALANAIIRLAENPDLRTQLAANGTKAARSFDRTELARQMLSHLQHQIS
ncbi:MAG: glycosyltransferase family 4 protein [Pseudomonadota bacterium]